MSRALEDVTAELQAAAARDRMSEVMRSQLDFRASRDQIIAKEGHKDDSGKPAFHLLAPEALEEIAKVLEFGARKYAPRNWERGMSWSRPFGAMMRHLWAWWGGEAKDKETGLSHLAHAGCCLMFLLAYERRGLGTDDRA